MTRDEVAAIQTAFAKSVEPMVTELQGIHGVLNDHSRILNEHTKILIEHTQILSEHSRLLNEHSQFLRNIDDRLVRVEGTLDGVEILVRSRTG